ncbi:Lrp/AsnC family transcriptional regulator [Saccharopolyspora sp. NPDC002376]
MQDSSVFDEVELEIVNALQVNPRASLERLGDVLGLSPATIARRWAGLRTRGDAWVTTAPGAKFGSVGASAFVRVSSAPSGLPAVLARLCDQPQFATISLVTGQSDVFVDCIASSSQVLADGLDQAFEGLDAVTRREVLVVVRTFRQGNEWRGNALGPGEVRALAQERLSPQREAAIDDVDARLIAALGEDGRATWHALGGIAGVSQQTARRRVERMLGKGYVALRCDTSLGGIPVGNVEVTLFANVPSRDLDTVGEHFALQSACRVAAEVLGAANFMLTLWVQQLSDLRHYEDQLAQICPKAVIVDRQSVMRTRKRSGNVLENDGRRDRYVPIALWG